MRTQFVAVLSLLIVMLVQAPAAPEFHVLVTGEVRYPGRVSLTAALLTVPDALAAVGSPTLNAADYIVVIRARELGETPSRTIISLKDLDEGTAGERAFLQDGDVVNVPMGTRFFISGFIKKPGAYRLPAGTTVSQAIIMAGGLSEGGNYRRIRIARVVSGKHVEIAAELDTAVLPGDEVKIQRKMF